MQHGMLIVISVASVLAFGLAVFLMPTHMSFLVAFMLLANLAVLWGVKLSFPHLKHLHLFDEDKTPIFITMAGVLGFLLDYFFLMPYTNKPTVDIVVPIAMGVYMGFATLAGYYTADGPTAFKTSGLLFLVALGTIFSTIK